jgi:hypothetical protein
LSRVLPETSSAIVAASVTLIDHLLLKIPIRVLYYKVLIRALISEVIYQSILKNSGGLDNSVGLRSGLAKDLSSP